MLKNPYLPAVLCLIGITVLSLSPSVPMPKLNLLSSDKLGHAFAYAILTWLMFSGYKSATGKDATWKTGWLFFGLSAGYGILMEIIQGTFFPYRFFEVADMIANAFGALMVVLFFAKSPKDTNQSQVH
ncbi:MAG: VanZ family protein [Saprospiraceae bacterium]